MNEILQQLARRKSVRAYEEVPVTAEEKRLILEAACQAPTAGNQQLYTIIDVTSQPLKDALAVSCDDPRYIFWRDMMIDRRTGIFLTCPNISFLLITTQNRS